MLARENVKFLRKENPGDDCGASLALTLKENLDKIDGKQRSESKHINMPPRAPGGFFEAHLSKKRIVAPFVDR